MATPRSSALILALLITGGLAGCNLLAISEQPYSAGDATVRLGGTEQDGPREPLEFTGGSWVSGTTNDSMAGGNASFVSADGWRLVINGVSEDGSQGAVTIGLEGTPDWEWVVGGWTDDGCVFDLEDGTPQVFAGTINCPALEARPSGETVAIDVAFAAR